MDSLDCISKLFETVNVQKTYRKGEYIYHKGESVSGIYKVLKGRVKLWKRSKKNNRNLLFYFVHSSEIFGILDNFNNSGVRRFSAITVDKYVVVQYVPYSDFVKYLQSNPNLCLVIIRYLLKKCEINWEKYCELLVDNTSQRVFKAIQKMANENGSTTNRGVILKGINHQDLADFTGVTRQSVAAAMSKFRRENKIEYNRNEILIKKSK